LQIKTKIVSSHTTDSKPVKQEVSGTEILPPPLVFPALANDKHSSISSENSFITFGPERHLAQKFAARNIFAPSGLGPVPGLGPLFGAPKIGLGPKIGLRSEPLVRQETDCTLVMIKTVFLRNLQRGK
jgi:hypothetical protein